MQVAADDELCELSVQEEFVGKAAKRTERRTPRDDITHQRAVLMLDEFVRMAKLAKRTGDHRVSKPMRRVEFSDLDCKHLPYAEHAALEPDTLAKSERTLVTHHGLRVQTRIAKEREASYRRCVNV